MNKTAKKVTRITLRITGDLYERISAQAEKNKRSINNELCWAVSEYLKGVEEKEHPIKYLGVIPGTLSPGQYRQMHKED